MTDGVAGRNARELAAEILGLLAQSGQTLAVAESLTGGLVAAALTDVPGSSVAFRGGIVAYATELKAELLGVDAAMLAAHGPVYPAVAAAMAAGVRDRLGATVGAATTGVAGPGPQDGQPAGTVHIAVSIRGGVPHNGVPHNGVPHNGVPHNDVPHNDAALDGDETIVRSIALPGDRDQVRRLAVERVLGLLLGRIREECP
jgi:nicotinamide-nucleotide amidase